MMAKENGNYFFKGIIIKNNKKNFQCLLLLKKKNQSYKAIVKLYI